MSPNLPSLWNDVVPRGSKMRPSHIVITMDAVILNIIHNIFNPSDTRVVICVTWTLWKEKWWPQPSFKFWIICKAIVRHNSETIINFEPKSNYLLMCSGTGPIRVLYTTLSFHISFIVSDSSASGFKWKFCSEIWEVYIFIFHISVKSGLECI